MKEVVLVELARLAAIILGSFLGQAIFAAQGGKPFGWPTAVTVGLVTYSVWVAILARVVQR